jgi:hypothetical protein
MTDEVKPNPSEAPTHDAQLVAESIASGDTKAPEDISKNVETFHGRSLQGF